MEADSFLLHIFGDIQVLSLAFGAVLTLVIVVIFLYLSGFVSASKMTLTGRLFQKKKKDGVFVEELSKALEFTSEEMTDKKGMLEGIIKLYNETAVEIMTPRVDMAALDIKQTFGNVIRYIVDKEYSRIPVFSENRDNINGVLYIKDLLPYLNKPDGFRWQSLVRPAFFVPEKKKIDDLLEEFRTNKIHLAIVVDEFGGTSGIVTMEDILEEIVGDISDEYDDDDDEKSTLQEENGLE